MSQVGFYLKRPNTATPQRIFAICPGQGKPLRIATPIPLRPSDSGRRVRCLGSSVLGAASFNDHLSQIQRETEETACRLQHNGRLTPE